MDESLRVAIYARVGSKPEAEEATIKSQIDALEQRLRADGYRLDETARFCDDGCSGASLRRPALERLRDAICLGSFDRVYVFASDRLARAVSKQVLLLEEFKRAGVECVFLNQPEPNRSPEGQLLLNMQGTFAEYEREKLLERTQRGRRFRARQGQVSALAQAPYGYRYVHKSQGGGVARYEVIADEAAWVRQMFRWVAVEGISLMAVARRLNEHQVPTRKGAKRWDGATIRCILSNTSYYGEARWGKTRMEERQLSKKPALGPPEVPRRAKVARPTAAEDQEKIPVPALIDVTLFDTVAERLQDNRKRQRERAVGAKYLLSGFLVCGRCGAAYCGRRLRGRVYYRCLGTDKYRTKKATVCDNPTVPEALEEQVWQDAYRMLREPKRLREELWRRQQAEPKSDGLSARRKQIARWKQQLARAIDLYQSSFLSKEEFSKRATPLKEKLAHEEKKLAEQSRGEQAARETQLLLAQFEKNAEQLLPGLENADLPMKRKVLKMLINRIEVGADGITINYNNNPYLPEIEAPSAK